MRRGSGLDRRIAMVERHWFGSARVAAVLRALDDGREAEMARQIALLSSRELERLVRDRELTERELSLLASKADPAAIDEGLRQLAERGLITDAMVEEVLARGPPELRGAAIEGADGSADG
jgi:hypothetical protein